MQKSDLGFFDFGLAGTSLQAALIAGLLAKEHGKKICFFVEGTLELRLSREINLSFDSFCRPQTWDLLQKSLKETLPIIHKIGGKRAICRINPLILCKSKSNEQAMAHLYHLLRNNDFEIEKLSIKKFPDAIAAFRIRGAHLVRQHILWPKIKAWLKTSGVAVIDSEGMQLVTHRDGSALVKTASGSIAVKRMILADEQAILNYGAQNDVERLFDKCLTSTIITKPAQKSNESLILNSEYRFSARSTPHGGFEVLADVAMDQMGILMGNFVDKDTKFKLLARNSFNNLRSKDGAAVVGKPSVSSAWMVGGFGYLGLFFSPSIARYICQKPNAAEQQYFVSHSANFKRKTQNIADFRSFLSGQL